MGAGCGDLCLFNPRVWTRGFPVIALRSLVLRVVLVLDGRHRLPRNYIRIGGFGEREEEISQVVARTIGCAESGRESATQSARMTTYTFRAIEGEGFMG